MSFDRIILTISALGILLGVVDRVLGNRFGLGARLEEGLNLMGPLALAMVGLICLAPVAGKLLGPVVTPFFCAIGCDASLLGTLLPCDTGGYPLAMALAQDADAGRYAGLIVASMFGCTLTFTLPLGMNLIEKKDRPYFLYGSLIGTVCIPFGCVVGGLVAGIDAGTVLRNTLPIALLSALFALGLKTVPRLMLKICGGVGYGVSALAALGLGAGGIEALTGLTLIPGLAPIEDGFAVVGSIAVVLMGMMPILALLTKLLQKPFGALGQRLGLDSQSTLGLLTALCNGVPVMKAVKEMNPRGKVVNCAFLVCASCALGDHLGFTAGVAPNYITPVIIGKVFGGLCSLALCRVFCKEIDKLEQKEKSE